MLWRAKGFDLDYYDDYELLERRFAPSGRRWPPWDVPLERAREQGEFGAALDERVHVCESDAPGSGEGGLR